VSGPEFEDDTGLGFYDREPGIDGTGRQRPLRHVRDGRARHESGRPYDTPSLPTRKGKSSKRQDALSTQIKAWKMVFNRLLLMVFFCAATSACIDPGIYGRRMWH
jgi:hypothetical protein